MAEELDYSRVERRQVEDDVIENIPVKDSKKKNRPSKFNFVLMVLVAAVLDILGIFLGFIAGAGLALEIVANLIFIPWFHFSGMKFTGKRIGLMGATTILESIPIIGSLPFITLNVILSYYFNE